MRASFTRHAPLTCRRTRRSPTSFFWPQDDRQLQSSFGRQARRQAWPNPGTRLRKSHCAGLTAAEQSLQTRAWIEVHLATALAICYSRGMDQPTVIERAFALAESGEYRRISDIRRQLKEEQYSAVEAHLAGPFLKRQLMNLCAQARSTEN